MHFLPMKGVFLFLSFVFLAQINLAQELNCEVIIDDSRLVTGQTSERDIFEKMQRSISDFINKQEWTTDIFDNEERISCTLQITLVNSPSQNVFEGTAQIQAKRPVYNTTYETITLSFIDRNFNFIYQPDQPLIYSENAFNDNLTAMLSFYAYLILAADYDSFSLLGGTKHAQKAFDIVNIAQTAGDPGWLQSGDTRNRYWMGENMIQQQITPFREGIYAYFRLGLDRYLLASNLDIVHEQVLGLLKNIEFVNQQIPESVLINSFLDAKYVEIVDMFSEAKGSIREEAYEILVKVDPGHTEKYEELIKN